MIFWRLLKLCSALQLASLAIFTGQVHALDNIVKKLNDPTLHCGHLPEMDLFNGVMNALSDPEGTAANLTLRREGRQLELLIHFEEESAQIPPDCLDKLAAINQSTKNRETGPILIRSSTHTEGSTELDLALASKRLDTIHTYFRENRLARKAFVVELHPDTSNPLFGDAITLPNVIEVYSSPAN